MRRGASARAGFDPAGRAVWAPPAPPCRPRRIHGVWRQPMRVVSPDGVAAGAAGRRLARCAAVAGAGGAQTRCGRAFHALLKRSSRSGGAGGPVHAKAGSKTSPATSQTRLLPRAPAPHASRWVGCEGPAEGPGRALTRVGPLHALLVNRACMQARAPPRARAFGATLRAGATKTRPARRSACLTGAGTWAARGRRPARCGRSSRHQWGQSLRLPVRHAPPPQT